MEYERKKNLKN